jgi:hypothetical protein
LPTLQEDLHFDFLVLVTPYIPEATMIKSLIKGSKSKACGGALQPKKLTIGTITLALFVILGSPLFAQAPALRQQPASVTAKRAMVIRCPQ